MDKNLQKYMAFVGTVEHGSFTKAAELLHYSQSGISRMINDLEHDWGVTLLARNKKGVVLTGDGMKLLPYAQTICRDYEQLKTQIDDLHGIQSGTIRIGTFSSVATHWLPNIIQSFQKDYPGIDYELLLGDYTEIEKWVEEGRVDCGFISLPAKSDFDFISLAEDELMAVLPEDHPLAGLEKVPLAALCEAPFMLLEKGSNSEVSKIFEGSGLTPRVHFTTWDDYAVMSMVESGLGVGILPKLILKRIPYKIAARSLDVPAYRTIGLILRSRREASAVTNRFLTYLDYREHNQKGK